MKYRASAIAALPSLTLLLSLSSLSRVVRGDNPIVRQIFTTDPAPIVVNDTMFVFTGHDEDGATDFVMKNWHAYSTTDMQNWQDRGQVASLATFAWADANAWACQVIARNNKFYFYAPVRHNTGPMAVGVAVSDHLLGPYTDALGKPLVENNEFDPTAFIDDDGQAYLYWGNPDLNWVTLNTNMTTFSGSQHQIPLTVASFGPRTNTGNGVRGTAFEEGPWFYRRNGLYYMVYAANCCPEDLRYATSPGPTGPWTYRGIIMPFGGASFTNHPGVIDYKGNSYLFYHNGALPGGSGFQRSVCVEQFSYTSNGSIPQISQTSSGPAQIGTLNPYVRVEAETMASSSGIETEATGENGGIVVSFIENGDFVKVRGVGFGSGAKSFSARASSATSGGRIELHLGSATGTIVGTCTVPGTGSWTTFTTVTCNVSGATGTQDLFLVFSGNSGFLFNFDWWQFTKA